MKSSGFYGNVDSNLNSLVYCLHFIMCESYNFSQKICNRKQVQIVDIWTIS